MNAAVVAVCLVAAAGPARAGAPYAHDEDRFQVELGDGWVKTDGEHRWTNAATGQTAIVTRTNARNDGAWSKRKSFFDSVIKGIRGGAAGYKPLRVRRGKAGRVPTLDVWFSYDAPDGAEVVVAMRFLFFHAYAVSLAVETPKARFRKQRRALRKLTRSFKPYFVEAE